MFGSHRRKQIPRFGSKDGHIVGMRGYGFGVEQLCIGSADGNFSMPTRHQASSDGGGLLGTD